MTRRREHGHQPLIRSIRGAFRNEAPPGAANAFGFWTAPATLGPSPCQGPRFYDDRDRGEQRGSRPGAVRRSAQKNTRVTAPSKRRSSGGPRTIDCRRSDASIDARSTRSGDLRPGAARSAGARAGRAGFDPKTSGNATSSAGMTQAGAGARVKGPTHEAPKRKGKSVRARERAGRAEARRYRRASAAVRAPRTSEEREMLSTHG